MEGLIFENLRLLTPLQILHSIHLYLRKIMPPEGKIISVGSRYSPNFN